MNIRLAVETDKEIWNSFVLSAKDRASFLQSWEWGQFQQAVNVSCWRLLVEQDGVVKAVALVVKHSLPLGQSWLYLPHGPVITEVSLIPSVLQELNAYVTELAQKESAMFVRIDPLLLESEKNILTAAGYKKSRKEVQPKDTLLLNLLQTEEELLAGMHKKTRYNIRLAEKKGVTVRFSSAEEDVKLFLKLTKEVAARTNFHFHDDEYYFSLLRELGKSGMAEVAIVEHEGDVLAAHIMVYFGAKATYAHGASSLLKKQLMAPTLLYWKTIQRAKEKGCASYDFYGIAPEGSGDNHPWSGVTRMKVGFGGKQVSYVGAHDLITKPLNYSLFTIVKKVRSLGK